jgi:hypothetical protein
MKPLRVVAVLLTSVLLVSSGRAERVGLSQTWVDNMRPPAYRIEGGSNEFHATGEICSLMQSFVLEAAGVKLKFSPKSRRSGRYVFSGKVDGVEVEGNGTYEVQYDGRFAIGIVAGAETYSLKQLPGACRNTF